MFGIVLSVMIFVILSGCAGQRGPSFSEQRAKAIRELGEAYMAEGYYTKALRKLLKAKKITPCDPHIHNDLGLTCLSKKSPEKAAEHFKTALELDPEYSAARNNLGSAYVIMKKWDKAIECFKKVSEDLLYLTPHYPLSNLGYAYYMKGAYNKAESYYLEALSRKHDFPQALHGLGQVYLSIGDVSKAVSKLELATERAPKAASFYMDLGEAYIMNHQFHKALQVYKKAALLAESAALADKAEAEAEKIINIY